jgi:PleD family two-component response regulator
MDAAEAARQCEVIRVEWFRLGLVNSAGSDRVMTASFGVAALVPSRDDDPALLLGAADRALYLAKRDGRNLVRTAGIDTIHQESAGDRPE